MARRRLSRGLARAFVAIVGFAVHVFVARAAFRWLMGPRVRPSTRPRRTRSRRAAPDTERAPAGPPDRDDTHELDGDLRDEEAPDETAPLRLEGPPVERDLLGVSWQPDDDAGRGDPR
ncbi:MAG: hypothetical protein QM704_27735 [Anaeromyxobacteraceae bacterium]